MRILSELLNPEHPLYVLAERIDWSQFDAAIDACYADELGRPGSTPGGWSACCI